jgi:hypothetical protein
MRGNSIGLGNRFVSALMSEILFALVFGGLVYFGYGNVSMSVTTTPSATAPLKRKGRFGQTECLLAAAADPLSRTISCGFAGDRHYGRVEAMDWAEDSGRTSASARF